MHVLARHAPAGSLMSQCWDLDLPGAFVRGPTGLSTCPALRGSEGDIALCPGCMMWWKAGRSKQSDTNEELEPDQTSQEQRMLPVQAGNKVWSVKLDPTA
jgi:hypothetical protein